MGLIEILKALRGQKPPNRTLDRFAFVHSLVRGNGRRIIIHNVEVFAGCIGLPHPGPNPRRQSSIFVRTSAETLGFLSFIYVHACIAVCLLDRRGAVTRIQFKTNPGDQADLVTVGKGVMPPM